MMTGREAGAGLLKLAGMGLGIGAAAILMTAAMESASPRDAREDADHRALNECNVRLSDQHPACRALRDEFHRRYGRAPC